jgi:predicted metal-dependent hydrolase
MSVTVGAAVARTQPREVVDGQPLREREPRGFALGGEVLSVRVRDSARARTARIIVGPRRPLEVIVPRGTEEEEVDALLEQKRGWIERKVAESRAIAARPKQLGLARPGIVWIDGRPLSVERQAGRRPIAELREGMVVVGGDADEAAAAIERWYRREARRRIAEIAGEGAVRLGLQFRSLAVRDQRTRWGSCSREGNLSFSWRLLVAPAEVREYVVVHELCHLREPTHAKPFWRLLEASRPGWQEQARWLREHGQELHEYEPTRIFVTR